MKAIRPIAASACVLAFSLSLTACSASAHQVINQGEACTGCHSEQKNTFEGASPSGTEAVAATVTVDTSADAIVVCAPIFTEEDGSYFVPESVRTVEASGGSATVELEPGTWVLAIDEGGTATSRLVTVQDGGADRISL